MSNRSLIPIKPSEIAKFLSISTMMILTLYVYSILRGTKNALIISEMGAEMVSTLKLWGVLPFAVIMMLTYTKIVDYFSNVATYHLINFFFLSFFLLFNFVFYPNAQYIHFDLSELIEKMPVLKYQITMVANWSYSLFYIMSELWGSMMLSLLFWQLANQISTTEEAKRFYPLFGFLGQVGLMGSGLFLSAFTHSQFANNLQESLNLISLSVLVAGILLSGVLFVLGNYIVGNDKINGEAIKSKKSKMGLINSLKYILSSKYVGLITLLILCYGISINLVEGVWNKQIGTLYTSSLEIGSFYAKVQIFTAFATFSAMLLGSYVMRTFSWKTAAIFTPTVILLTGAPFFIFISFGSEISSIFNTSGKMLLVLAVIFGAAQNVLSKAIKYSFFDPTKEMAYIPLDPELKAKGKAAADVIGGRLGKSGGAIIQWSMLSFIAGSTLTSLSPMLFGMFIITMAIWFYAVLKLSKEYQRKSESMAP